jgi:3D (Asp-Asp-Asp) domain-containing protein
MTARSLAERAGRLLRWWFAGLSGRGLWPGARLALAGLAIGWLVGWSAGMTLKIVVIEEKQLPRPVLPPPMGARWVPVKTTGYCPCWRCCGAFANGRTAINRDVQKFPFGIAVEPRLLPYRLELDVPGYGRALVDDTGGAMRQSAQQGTVHLDLRFETHQTALNWGVRRMWIAVPETAPAAQLAPPR